MPPMPTGSRLAKLNACSGRTYEGSDEVGSKPVLVMLQANGIARRCRILQVNVRTVFAEADRSNAKVRSQLFPKRAKCQLQPAVQACRQRFGRVVSNAGRRSSITAQRGLWLIHT
jgi:hypothetical protein